MLSKYDEISKLIRNYIDNVLETKYVKNADTLNNQIKQTYGVSLPEVDLVKLQSALSNAINFRTDYEVAVKNSSKAVTDWSNALSKSRDLLARREGEVRDYGTNLANKLCIMLYKGPLTLDTMKELKEQGYDGTYGSTTMMQMYALYNENQKLEEKNSKQNATILQQQTQIDSYMQQYRSQYQVLQQTKVENEGLKRENTQLKTSQTALTEKISEQNKLIEGLIQKVEQLSKRLPIQILEGIKEFFGMSKGTITEIKEEEKKMH